MLERIRNARAYVSGEGLGAFLVRAVAGSGAVRIGAMAASFAVGVQLARMLGVEGYGYYGLALSIVTIAGIPGEMGIPQLVTREVAAAVARNDDRHIFGVLRWALRVVLPLSVVTAAIAVAASLIASAKQPSVLAIAILCGAPVIPLMALARIEGGALQGLHHVVRGQIPANLIRPVLLSIALAVIYFVRLPIGAAGAMALNSITAAAAFAVAFAWLRRRLPKRQPPDLVRTNRQWIVSSIPMALTDGMRILQTELTILLIGFLAHPADVGLFRAAIITATTAAVALPVVNQVALPTIARLFAAREHSQLQKLVTFSAWAQFAGVCILSLPLLIAAGPILSLVFGPSYAAAANPMRIIAIGQIANAAFGPNVALLNMTHHERRVTRAMTAALVINVAGVLVLTNLWGAEGAAIAFVAALICWNVVTWLDARKFLGVETSIIPGSAGT